MSLPTTILIADNSASMRRIIIDILNEIGNYNFVEVANGKDAIDMLFMHKIDLIISDWHMPKVKGSEFLKAVRSHSTLKNTPFVMVTTEKSKEHQKEAMALGASEYITKPFNRGQLLGKLQAILSWLS